MPSLLSSGVLVATAASDAPGPGGRLSDELGLPFGGPRAGEKRQGTILNGGLEVPFLNANDAAYRHCLLLGQGLHRMPRRCGCHCGSGGIECPELKYRPACRRH